MSTPNSAPNPPLSLPAGLNPDALDVLSDLANLLTRLRTLPAPSGTTTTPAAATPAAPTPTASAATGATGKKGAGAELTLKEFPAATDVLRHRFQKARVLIRTQLPDLDRSIADQEVEIRRLEQRISRQRDELAKLKDVGARLGVVEVSIEGGDRMVE